MWSASSLCLHYMHTTTARGPGFFAQAPVSFARTIVAACAYARKRERKRERDRPQNKYTVKRTPIMFSSPHTDAITAKRVEKEEKNCPERV